MTSKHRKTHRPSDRDLKDNPLIGGSKGTTMAGITPDELERAQGANTIEGDVENDSTRADGVPEEERERTNA